MDLLNPLVASGLVEKIGGKKQPLHPPPTFKFERAPDDQPSIGIILCAEKDDVEVEFALKTKTNPIGVAEYQLRSTLPAEFKGRLPSAKQLAEVVRKAKEER